VGVDGIRISGVADRLSSPGRADSLSTAGAGSEGRATRSLLLGVAVTRNSCHGIEIAARLGRTQMKQVRRFAVLVSSLLMVVMAGAGTAQAAPKPPPAAEAVESVLQANEFYVTSGDAVLVTPEVLTRLQKSGKTQDARVQAALASDPPWAACGVYDSNTKVVYTYSRAQISGYSGSTAKLLCGSTSWGFRHIEASHMADWQAKGEYIGATWSQMAHWAMTNTLSKPCSKYYQSSNDTFQYVAPFQIRNNQGQVVHTFGARVVVARVTQNIITSYPQSSTC
jgi:hypothetical protein